MSGPPVLGRGTKVTKLPGGANLPDPDIAYFHKRLMAGMSTLGLKMDRLKDVREPWWRRITG